MLDKGFQLAYMYKNIHSQTYELNYLPIENLYRNVKIILRKRKRQTDRLKAKLNFKMI